MPYEIEWETTELSPALLDKIRGYALVHDFGGDALTALNWTLGEGIAIETAHVYPECGRVVLTRTRVGGKP
jgi:hypothetical protein